jgi:hypothetical protein
VRKVPRYIRIGSPRRGWGMPGGSTMSTDAVVGCFLVAGAVCLLTYLVVWSRRTIHRIDRIGARSAREVLSELRESG